MQAFSMELSSLEETLLSIQSDLDTSGNTKTDQDSKLILTDIISCCKSVLTLKDTCCFMNATINRCLDYSKATAGLALSPVNSTINLRDAIDWAVSCINRTQEGKVRIFMLNRDY